MVMIMQHLPTEAQLQACNTLLSLPLHAHEVVATHDEHGVKRVLSSALEATREFVPAELRSTVDCILDTCAMEVEV